MRRASVASLLLIGAALAGTHPALLRAQAVQRSMYVSVLNEAGAFVPDLGPRDFLVREDNVAREVLRVAPADDPMQVAVLVDNSQAARDYIRDIRQGLHQFVTEMTSAESGAKHELSIVSFADRPTILADLTSDRDKLHKGVDRIFEQTQSGAYLLDAISEVSRGFVKRRAPRPVIVAITTEGPEFSPLYFDTVLDRLRDAGAALHVIVVGPLSSDLSDEARNRAIVIERGPTGTGGIRDHLLTSMALPAKLKQLAANLTHQYRITFAHPQSLIPPERVTVSATRPGLTAHGTLVKEQRGQERP